MAYVLGWYLARITTPKVNPEFITFTKCRSMSIVIVLLGYLLLRAPIIYEILYSLIKSEFATYALNRAMSRYNGETMGAVYNFGTVFFVCYFGLVGTHLGLSEQRSFNNTSPLKRRKIRWMVVISLFFMVFVESSGLARAGVLLALVLFTANYLYAKRVDIQNISSKKLLALCFKSLLIIFIVFYFSAYFRLLDNANALEVLVEKSYLYFVGGHEAFAMWINKSRGEIFSSYGFNTFTALFKLIGIEDQSGHYTKYVHNGSNIFLLYRGLLQDFGFFFTSIFLIIISFLANSGDSYKHSFPGLIYLTKAAVCMLLFVFYSPFLFTTFLFGFLLSCVLQKKIYRRIRRI